MILGLWWISPTGSRCSTTAARLPTAPPPRFAPTRPSSTPIWASLMTTNLSRTPHERLRLFVPFGGPDRRPLVRRHVLAGRDRLRADLQDLGRAQFCAGRDGAVRRADIRRHSRARRALLRQSSAHALDHGRARRRGGAVGAAAAGQQAAD